MPSGGSKNLGHHGERWEPVASDASPVARPMVEGVRARLWSIQKTLEANIVEALDAVRRILE